MDTIALPWDDERCETGNASGKCSDTVAVARATMAALAWYHLAANGRMLFELDEESVGKMLQSVLCGTANPDADVAFHGLSKPLIELFRGASCKAQCIPCVEQRIAQHLVERIDQLS